MITIKEWFRKFHNRPLKIAASFLLAVWFVFAQRSYVSISDKQMSALKQTADLLSMAAQSKDRVMVESLLETLLSQGGAKSAALCKGEIQIVGANQDLFGCIDQNSFFDKILDRKIPGSGDIFLRAKFDMLASLSAILYILGFGLMLVLGGFYFIQVAQSRIDSDILKPLLNNLLSTESIEIKELYDLKLKIKEAKDLEAQKAVTLAIQDNNEQVAHDIRSPIQSIAELISKVNVTDNELKTALDKAIKRANAVSNFLLANEKQIALPSNDVSVFDFSAIARDIALEKKPLFFEGEIEVIGPKYLFASSQLSSGSLARVLSNIVDNAILACTQRKMIRIFLTRQEESVLITVSDTGRGIALEVMNKIGLKGVSFREDSEPKGSGRGVYSAKKTLDEVGGRIDFESSPGFGTTVSIVIPIKSPQPIESSDVVLVDNEEITRLTWSLAATREGKKCLTFPSIDQFLVISDFLPRSLPIFLDSDLAWISTERNSPNIL